MKQTQQEKAAIIELKILQEKYEIGRRIVTPEGFYQEWFNSLPFYDTYIEAFDVLNEIHYNHVLPPRYKYSCYQSFKTANKTRIDGIKNR